MLASCFARYSHLIKNHNKMLARGVKIARVAGRRAAAAQHFSTTSSAAGFIGLGSMGSAIAGSLGKRTGGDVYVYDASPDAVQKHCDASSFARGKESIGGVLDALSESSGSHQFLFSCLPNSKIVDAVKKEVQSHLAKRDAASPIIWVDCTSGDPSTTQQIAAEMKQSGVLFVDCPVSGGPAGASAGTLTAMLGSDDEDAVDAVTPLVESFAKNIVHIGPSGSGHAVKAINNTLLGAHIAMVSEGLVALKKLGVCPEDALNAINGSSGRSWVSMQRFPDHVLPQTYDYGFSLELLLKDMNIGVNLVDDVGSKTRFLDSLKTSIEEHVAHVSADERGKVDHLEISRIIEEKNACPLNPLKSK